ncbi:hypothetical protein ACM9XA_03370 [Xanthomonas sacchari]
MAARVTALEDGGAGGGSIQGIGSIVTQGSPPGIVQISLEGDTDTPGNTWYYGTAPDGSRGWWALSDGLAVTTDLTKSVGSDGVATFGLADIANSGTGTLLATTFDAKGRRTGSKAATITGTANQVDVANGNAAAGLPTISLAAQVLTSLGKADSAVQEVRAGTNVSVDNTDPRRPIVSSTAPAGVPEAPTDGYPYVRRAGAWEQTNSPSARYWLIEYPLLTDQAGNQLTDQAGNLLISNSPIVPPGWPSTAATTVNTTTTLQAMTLAEANALANPQDFQMVAIVDLTGGREPCWYDASVGSGTKWRRFSDRSIAS